MKLKLNKIVILGLFIIISTHSYGSTGFQIGDSYESVLKSINKNSQCQNLSENSKNKTSMPIKLVLSCKNQASIGIEEKLTLSFEGGKLKYFETQADQLNLGPVKLNTREIIAWFRKYLSKVVLI